MWFLRDLKVWMVYQEWALLKEHAWQVCIAFKTRHPASQTGKGTSLKQNCDEEMKDKLDVCIRERKSNKAVSIREKEIVITESKLYTTQKCEAFCS